MATGDFRNGTSLVGKILCSVQLASTGENTVYTTPANQYVKIAHGVICNTSSSAVTIGVSLVPSGGSADGTHKIIYSYSLAADDSLSLSSYLAGAVMGPGDFISVNTGTANVIDVVITGSVSS